LADGRTVGVAAMVSTAEKLTQYVRSLADFTVYESAGGSYNHMGATIADAVLQANNKYESNVTPRVTRILRVYSEARTTSAVVELLKSVPAKEFLNWGGEDRALRFCQIAGLFKTERLETEFDLRAWLESRANRAKLDAIYGIGEKTIDYFKILCGESTSAIDRHLLGFLDLAGIKTSSYQGAQNVINATADLLGIDRACFDHSIWQFMRKRAAPRETQSRNGGR
jgi:hypothetical protein